MKVELLTVKSLEDFKKELLNEIKRLIFETSYEKKPQKKWLKGAEVRSLLQISDGKLQRLRIKGILKSSKIGGVHYYDWNDIQRMFEEKTAGLKRIGDV